MSILVVKSAALVLAGTFAETKFSTANNTNGPAGLSSVYGVTPAIFSGLSFWILVHGMKVGAARTKYMELAKKDGEKEVEERYDLPNLYAQGTSKHVLSFNCVQRSHQHIFETFTGAVLTGMVGAVQYPLTTAVATCIYAVGRISLSNGYAASEGKPSLRYSSSLAILNWYGLMGNIFLSFLSVASMIAGKKLW